jgi:hypothetical protein
MTPPRIPAFPFLMTTAAQSRKKFAAIKSTPSNPIALRFDVAFVLQSVVP